MKRNKAHRNNQRLARYRKTVLAVEIGREAIAVIDTEVAKTGGTASRRDVIEELVKKCLQSATPKTQDASGGTTGQGTGANVADQRSGSDTMTVEPEEGTQDLTIKSHVLLSPACDSIVGPSETPNVSGMLTEQSGGGCASKNLVKLSKVTIWEEGNSLCVQFEGVDWRRNPLYSVGFRRDKRDPAYVWRFPVTPGRSVIHRAHVEEFLNGVVAADTFIDSMEADNPTS
jgi:hypothetical protein